MPVFYQDPKIREVAKITDTDEGKVLTAKDGEAVWEEATGGSVNVVTAGSATELPSNVPDRTIGLVPAESEDGDGDVFLVNIKETEKDQFTSDKTVAEALEAYDSKKHVVFRFIERSGYGDYFAEGTVVLTSRDPYIGYFWYTNGFLDLMVSNYNTTDNADKYSYSVLSNPVRTAPNYQDGMVLTTEDGKAVWKEPAGGGSSVQPDYNQNDSEQPDYIKNRPFYEETVTGEVVIEYDGDPTGKVVVSIGEDGQLVKVSDLTPEPSELIGGTGIVNGESMTITEDMVMDGRTEGVPAVVVAEVMFVFYSPFAAYGITETGIYFADMGVAATLKYTGTVTNIKKLDPKFLEFFKVSDTPIVDETVNVGPDGGTFSNAFTLVVGETYSVEFDGTRYSCVSKSVVLGEIIVIYVGNANIYFGLEDTGEPFCIFCFEGGSAVDTRLEHEGDRSIKIYHVECAKIPKECLPDDIGSSGLPEVTEEDNGKILGVENGEWKLISKELPEVTEEDNGKILGVENGEWKLISKELPEVTANEDGAMLIVQDGAWKLHKHAFENWIEVKEFAGTDKALACRYCSECNYTETVVRPINGSVEHPLSVTDTLAKAANLEDGDFTDVPYYTKGVITEIGQAGAYYKNVYFTDGEQTMLIYTMNPFEGMSGLKVGDTITVYGYINCYFTTIQFHTKDVNSDNPIYVYVVAHEPA